MAEHAGFTKGAFYANFASKEELFLALLDEHFADVLERVDLAISGDDDLLDQAREGAASFMRFIAADPDWERLFFDFSALRDAQRGVPRRAGGSPPRPARRNRHAAPAARRPARHRAAGAGA